MDMKNTITNNRNILYPTNNGSYNNDDITTNLNVSNTNESYLKNSENNYSVSNDPIIQNGEYHVQNELNKTNNAITNINLQQNQPQYYQYKSPIDQTNSYNTSTSVDYNNPNLYQHTLLSNNYPTPNICPTTGYEAIQLPTNPGFPCSCAYCINFYQSQWYLNYYNQLTNPTASYIIPNNNNEQHQLNPTNNLSPKSVSQSPFLFMKPTNNDLLYNINPNQDNQEVDQKLAHLTPIYINQPVPSNTEHFQRRTPFKKRDHNALSWLLLYLELEKDVESPTLNARIAWINDMHHIIYTKLTSGLISRWQYEYEFTQLKNLITQKSIEADDMFKLYPRLCHCGERFKSDLELNEHTNQCIELKIPWHRCLCGQLFDQHNEFFQHIFSGILQCPMAVYHLWIFFEKYRRRRYKCFCTIIFHNFWVYYVHMGECCEYQSYFQRNCYFCQDSIKKISSSTSNLNSTIDSNNTTVNSTTNACWNFPMVGPLKDLVRYSKLQ